jgi:hypothetical protein
MKRTRPFGRLLWLTVGAFVLGAAVSWWKIADEGVTTRDMISAVAFTVAALIWGFIAVREGRTDGPGG